MEAGHRGFSVVGKIFYSSQGNSYLFISIHCIDSKLSEWHVFPTESSGISVQLEHHLGETEKRGLERKEAAGEEKCSE